MDVAALAAVVAERGDQAMRADAVSAALLAEAAARAAATLVEVNLGTTSSDERVTGRRDLAGSATAAAQRPAARSARRSSAPSLVSPGTEDPLPLRGLVVVGHDESDGFGGGTMGYRH